MVKLIKIEKKFPDGKNSYNHVLCGIDLTIEKGDFIAIKGASGSGKTTLLSILGTLIQPEDGKYLFENKQINAPNTDYSQFRHRNVGFVFQDNRLLPQLTAIENILLPTIVCQNKSEVAQIDYAKKLMELIGITSVAEQYPETLSGGETSRVALCRALIMKPMLILADEPTGQLDADNAHKIMLLLNKINKELKTAIVMVTHSDETAKYASTIYLLSDGVLKLDN
ncbi:MAG: ABC transporter ATP-binding protein [Marinilabiliaceae bacterium]|nr:ABC transporter ATP-binding protein [Marinilabiliaceae bacterium]